MTDDRIPLSEKELQKMPVAISMSAVGWQSTKYKRIFTKAIGTRIYIAAWYTDVPALQRTATTPSIWMLIKVPNRFNLYEFYYVRYTPDFARLYTIDDLNLIKGHLTVREGMTYPTLEQALDLVYQKMYP